MIYINGNDLTIEQVIAVSREGETVAIAPEAVERINADPESFRSLLVEKASLSDDVAKTYPISTYPTCQLPTQEQVDDVLAWMKHKGYLAEGVTYRATDGTFAGR